ncbi:MAG: hypothetical protein JNG86_12000, partial [Verrucomicrobiaceae bacterium]|nr:hypothetical protein [Verrucomicrobiaceae bacterium]
LESPAPASNKADATLEIATLPEGGGFLSEEDEAADLPPSASAPPHEDYFPDLPPTVEAAPEPPPADLEPENSSVEHEEDTTPVEGADATLPLERIRERLRAIRHRAVEAGLLNRGADDAPSVPVAEDAPEVLDPRAKLGAFAETESASLPAGSTLIALDEEGGVLWSNEPRPGLILSMLMARRAAQHASIEALADSPAVSHHALPPDHTLSIVSVATSTGILQIAVKGGAPLEQALAERWRAMLGGQ